MPSGLSVGNDGNRLGGGFGGDTGGGNNDGFDQGGPSYNALNDDVFSQPPSSPIYGGRVPGMDVLGGDNDNYLNQDLGGFPVLQPIKQPKPSFFKNPFAATPARYTPLAEPPKPTWSGRFSDDVSDDLSTAAPPEQGFWDSDFGKGLRKFGLFAANFHPATRVAAGLYNMYNAAQQGQYGNVASGALGMLGANPLGAGLVGLGVDAVTGRPDTGQRAGGFIGGQFGGRIGSSLGPLGGLIGSEAGSYLGRTLADAPATGGNKMSYGGAGGGPSFVYPGLGDSLGQQFPKDQQTARTEQGGSNWLGPTLGGLAGLYMLNRGNRDSKQSQAELQNLNNMFQQQMQQALANRPSPRMAAARQPNFAGIDRKLSEMFGPNSAVAREMRSQVERKDAAAGRRSQYGPREVELAAQLTALRANAEPSYMNAEVGAANAFNQVSAQNAAAHNQFALQEWQNRLSGLQGLAQNRLGMVQSNQTAQANRRQQQMQIANILYGMGKETGAFKWAQDGISNWWNNS